MTTMLLTPQEEPKLLPPFTHEPYELHANAVAGITIVKRFGLADMCNREQVIRIVDRMGFEDGAAWLRANRHLYFVLLRTVMAE
jgi:hypothetical protein